MLWACIVFPRLALDAVLRRCDDPHAPLALVTGPAQLRSLHAVNDAAVQAGLKPGMRLPAAHALCGEARWVDHDPAREAQAHRFLAAWAYRYSSHVCIQWPGAIVLEVAASFRLLGSWPQLQERLRAELDALGFVHRIALAPVPRAALVFATLRDGFCVVEQGALHAALARVPVRGAQLPGDAGTQLHRMGLRTLEALRCLPSDALRRRFGAPLAAHLSRLYGEAEDPLACYAPPDHFDMRIELGFEVEHHPALLFPLRRLVGDLCAYLAARDGGVQRFVLRLEHEKDHTDVPVGLLAPEKDAALLFDLARNRLEQASIPRAVVALRLLAHDLPPFVPIARDLFDARPSRSIDWPQLRERLRARLGDARVFRIAPACDPRPERAWRRDAAMPAHLPPLPPRPTWLLPEPVPLQDPVLRIVAGPERLESGWWDGGDVRRDYYVLQTARGRLAWAFARVGQRGPWMLHGWFA
jgi:protein ImuB